jgi:hypothetical protein
MGNITCRFGPAGEHIGSTAATELGYHDETMPSSIGPSCIAEVEVNCPSLSKCGSCPDRLDNGGEGSLSERMGDAILRVSDATTRPFRAAKELVGRLLGRNKQ